MCGALLFPPMQPNTVWKWPLEDFEPSWPSGHIWTLPDVVLLVGRVNFVKSVPQDTLPSTRMNSPSLGVSKVPFLSIVYNLMLTHFVIFVQQFQHLIHRWYQVNGLWLAFWLRELVTGNWNDSSCFGKRKQKFDETLNTGKPWMVLLITCPRNTGRFLILNCLISQKC